MEQWLADLLVEVNTDLAKLGIATEDASYTTKRRMAILRRWPDAVVRAAEQDKRNGDDTATLRYDDEVRQIKAAIPKPNPDLAAEKESQLQVGRELRDGVLNRLNLLRVDAMLSNDTTALSAINDAIAALKTITAWQAVVDATGADETRAAFMTRYGQIGATLRAASPDAYAEFRGLDT